MFIYEHPHAYQGNTVIDELLQIQKVSFLSDANPNPLSTGLVQNISWEDRSVPFSSIT
jgi:hypothetical protein